MLVSWMVCASALPPAYTRTEVLQHPGAPLFPSKSVAIATAHGAALPAPSVVYSALPTQRFHTGTKVTVHYEPIEQHGYVIRY